MCRREWAFGILRAAHSQHFPEARVLSAVFRVVVSQGHIWVPVNSEEAE